MARGAARPGRRTVLTVAATAALTTACSEPRRPTPEELRSWDRSADLIVVLSIVWELMALAAVSFGVWDIVRRRSDVPPAWPRSIGLLVLVAGAIMLVGTAFPFVRLWTA